MTIATGVWSSDIPEAWAGYSLAASGGVERPAVLVGVPILSYSAYLHDPALVALSVTNLEWLGSYEDQDLGGSGVTSGFGASVAVAPDGRIAVGAPFGSETADTQGTVMVLESLPDDVGVPAPTLIVRGSTHRFAWLGQAVAWVDVTGSGPELVASAPSGASDQPGVIYRFPSELTGDHGLDTAAAVITGAQGLGTRLTGWDGDSDGLTDLVAMLGQGDVGRFPGPWTADLTSADADVSWSEDPMGQLEPRPMVGDVDGDGAADLALGAETLDGRDVRSGALYVVPAGLLASGPASDLPIQVVGTETGEGVGSAAAAGDYDGDGRVDLVVGAYGVLPGARSGEVLGYLGPLTPGVRTAADADFMVHGEAAFDWFGTEALTVEADGDGRDDLVVAAQGWGGGAGRVYLLRGADIAP